MKLENNVDILSGYAFKSKLFNTEGNGIPIIRIRDVTSNSVSTYYDGDYKDEFIVCDGDLLVGMDGQFSLIEWHGGKALLNQRVCKITPKKDKIEKGFLKYLVPKSLKEIEDKTSFATVKHLTVKKIKEITLPSTSIEIQKKIAQTLDDATALRNKTENLIKEYDLLEQSLFLDMFGDPLINEKKWHFIELNKLVVQKPDNGFFAKNEFYSDKGTPIVWITNFINKVYVDVDGLRRAKTNDRDLKYSLQYGDALFCRSSLTVDGIGKCAIVPRNLNEVILFECHIIRLRFDTNKLIPEYFRFLSDTTFFRNNIMKSSKTSTMTTISQDGISKINIPVPPIDLQNQFAEKITLIEKQKELAKQELKESEDLFNCLLQKAFKGELVL